MVISYEQSRGRQVLAVPMSRTVGLGGARENSPEFPSVAQRTFLMTQSPGGRFEVFSNSTFLELKRSLRFPRPSLREFSLPNGALNNPARSDTWVAHPQAAPPVSACDVIKEGCERCARLDKPVEKEDWMHPERKLRRRMV